MNPKSYPYQTGGRTERIGRADPQRTLLPSERRYCGAGRRVAGLADVPGAKGDAIDVKFEDGTLEIRARWRSGKETSRATCCANTA